MTSVRQFLRVETFTGWHMLTIMVLFFGTIISVNVTMAWFASSSWSGLLVENTYVASQKFDDEVAINREMQARGWKSDLSVEDGVLIYQLADAGGDPILVDAVSVLLHRPVGVVEDQHVSLTHLGSERYSSKVTMEPGHWVAKITANKDGALHYREALRLDLSANGSSQ